MDRGPVRCPDRLVPAELSALALYRAELDERLVVHLTGGAWRVPLGVRPLPVLAADGSLLGRIVCGEGRDAARARAGLAPAPAAPDPARLMALLAPWAGLLAAVRGLEGAPCAPVRAAAGAGPALLETPPGAEPAALVAALAALAPRGVVWRPDPGGAASAHLIARALAPGLGRALALVQGDRATGAALAAAGLSPAA